MLRNLKKKNDKVISRKYFTFRQQKFKYIKHGSHKVHNEENQEKLHAYERQLFAVQTCVTLNKSTMNIHTFQYLLDAYS